MIYSRNIFHVIQPKNLLNMRKRIVLFALLSFLLFPVAAQETAGMTYTFRFVTGDDMFYVPWSGNGAELDRLLACVRDHKADIRWHDSGLC